jgi:beta-lactamase superfamily II metal-dependent hydrolase
MLEMQLLPARQGDAIWIRWGDASQPHQILIDMGTEGVGENVRQRILALPEDKRFFELLVVTHIDRDHIGGVLTCLAEAEPIKGFAVSDIWFNGFPHINGGRVTSNLEPMGAADGKRLSNWLAQQHWNVAFDGRAVQRVSGQPGREVTLSDGLTLTVLGPTPERLKALESVWTVEVEKAVSKEKPKAKSGLESFGSKTPPQLTGKHDLQHLADTRNDQDTSKPNGSSIALLLEYKGNRIILTGDAYAEDLVTAIKYLSNGDQRLSVDAFKVPHHGSTNNMSASLVKSVDCKRWVFSTDGTQFRHPDAVALARVIHYSNIRPVQLAFNVPSKYNGWWNNDDWQAMYDYKAEYGSSENGLTLSFSLED